MPSALSALMFNHGAKKNSNYVLGKLGIRPGETIADIGSGGGHYTLRFSKAVGIEGTVFAIDVDVELLRHVQSIAKRQRNIQTILASEEGFSLPVSCDLMFMRNAFHHLGDAVSYFHSIGVYLKPEGRITVIERRPDGKGVHNTSEDIICNTMEAAGFCRLRSFNDLPDYSFNIFSRRL